jgi:hypothetical protein
LWRRLNLYAHQMPIGAERYTPSRVPEDHYQVLLKASSRLIDRHLDALGRDEGAAGLAGADLPPAFLPRYTADFLRRYLVCMVTVAWKLRAPGRHQLSCIAEELALRAMIELAYSLPEEDGQVPERDYGWFMVEAFDDREFEQLFDQPAADVETAETHLPAHLRFEQWFAPFRQHEPVHPYVDQK